VKPRTLLVLLALVVGLGAFVWFYEREQPGSAERAKLSRRVLGVEREQVTGVELESGGQTTELVRTRKAGDDGAKQDEWRLRRPIDFRADYWQVDGLVRSLAELERVRELATWKPDQVGLDQPRGRVVVALEGGGTRELRIGAEVPGADQMIVAVEGEPEASVVATSLWTSMAKSPEEWRDKDLFAPEREDVRELLLERGSDVVRLARSGDDFELTEPFGDRADQDAVNALLRELTGLRASAFLDSPPPPLHDVGLDPPAARLTVTLASGEPFVLLWGSRKEGAEENYARTGDLVVTTAAALGAALERSAADWRSKAWSSIPVFEVDQVTVTGSGEPLTVTRDEGSWRRGEDTVAYGPVSDFLYAIDDARAERIAAPGEVALGQAEVSITLSALAEPGAQKTGAAKEPTPPPAPGGAGQPSGQAPEKAERLDLFAPTAENLVPVRADGRDAILLIRRETRDQILAKLQAVRDAKPAGEEPTPAPAAPPG
jgi:hypothetical protein